MRRILGIALLAVAVLQLGFRGRQRVRNDVPMWDFASVYAAARTWVQGGDPYDVNRVVQTWHEAHFFADRDVSYFATVYPPSSLITLIPFALMPAGAAMAAWLLLTIVLLVLQFIALADMAALRWDDPRALILVGGTLASAALQFGILSGQLSIPAISLCLIACWCARRERGVLAGVLLGLACAVKPQVAAPFIAYYLVLRRLNVAVASILVCAMVWAVALVAMHSTHIDWMAGWKQSIAATTRPGGVNDYGWANRFRDEIVDLKMILANFSHNASLLRAAVAAVVVVLLAAYVRSFPRGGPETGRHELLALAALSALSLLPVYHRVYDVALLATALAWALVELDGALRKYAIAVLIPLAVFLVPFDSVKSVGNRMHFLSGLGRKWWWQSLVLPHYAWALLATMIVLLIALDRRANAVGHGAVRRRAFCLIRGFIPVRLHSRRSE